MRGVSKEGKTERDLREKYEDGKSKIKSKGNGRTYEGRGKVRGSGKILKGRGKVRVQGGRTREGTGMVRENEKKS